MNQSDIIKLYVKMLLAEAQTEKLSSAALNPLIGHITETTAALVAMGVEIPSDLVSYKRAVLSNVSVADPRRATAYIDGAWKGLAAAGQLDTQMARGVAMGEHLLKYLDDAGVEDRGVEWTGPGGGTAEGVGTADIVVTGVAPDEDGNLVDFKQGFSAKASKSAAKTLGGLSLAKLFPNLGDELTSSINEYARKKAAELAAAAAGDPNWLDAVWPTGNNGYAGAWMITNPGRVYDAGKHRSAGEDIWRNSVTNGLSVGIANEVLNKVQPHLRRAAKAIYNHLKEGSSVLKLLPSGIEENNPIADKLSEAISGRKKLSAAVDGTGVVISVAGQPLIKLRPRVKDPGRSVSVNTTVEPAATRERTPGEATSASSI